MSDPESGGFRLGDDGEISGNIVITDVEAKSKRRSRLVQWSLRVVTLLIIMVISGVGSIFLYMNFSRLAQRPPCALLSEVGGINGMLMVGLTVYRADHTQAQNIYLMNFDGTGAKVVKSNIPLDETQIDDLSVSPNGKYVLSTQYVHQDSGNKDYVVVTDLGTMDDKPLLPGEFPGWSWDNNRIAFVERGRQQISIINRDGSNLESLLSTFPVISPLAWSPDGKQIAVSVQSNGNSIYLIDIVTKAQTELISDGDMNEYPEWSPDGKYVAYVSHKSMGNPDIFIISPDKTTRYNLTKGKYRVQLNTPVWSSDSKQVAFIVNDEAPIQSLYVANVDGSGVHRVKTACELTQ